MDGDLELVGLQKPSPIKVSICKMVMAMDKELASSLNIKQVFFVCIQCWTICANSLSITITQFPRVLSIFGTNSWLMGWSATHTQMSGPARNFRMSNLCNMYDWMCSVSCLCLGSSFVRQCFWQDDSSAFKVMKLDTIS